MVRDDPSKSCVGDYSGMDLLSLVRYTRLTKGAKIVTHEYRLSLFKFFWEKSRIFLVRRVGKIFANKLVVQL